MARLSALVCLGACLLPAAAAAQDDPRLPSLTPRVFESRGTIRVSLPDIARQPLSGFGPPPRVFVVPEDRRPATRPFDPDLDALPRLALGAPPEPPSDLDAPRRLRLEGGAGTQFARYGRADLTAIGAAGTFWADADYDGLSGRDDDGRVHFDRLDVRAGGQSFAPGRLRIEAHALVDRYSTPGSILSDRRERRSLGAEAGAEGVGRVPYAVTLGFAQGQLQRLDDSEPESTEGRLDGAARVGLLDDRFRLDAAAGTAGAGEGLTDVQYALAGAAVAFERPDGARLVVGLRGLTYDASSLAGGGDSQTVGPILDLRLPLGETGTLFATNDPHLTVRSLTDLTGANPYVAPDPIVAPDVLPIDARAGLEIHRGPARLRGYAMGVYAPTFLVFERLGDDYRETYVDARIYGVGGDLALALPSGVSATAGVEARTASVDGDDEIPFYAPLVARAGLQVPFAGGRGRVGVTASAESARPADRTDAERAPAFGLVGFDARYDISGPFSAVLRGERLVGEVERWPGFPEAPYAVMAGIRFSR